MLNGKTLSGCLCLQAEGELEEGGMLSMLKRHEVKILLKAGHGKAEVARLAGVCLCSVKRIAQEGPVVHVDDHGERAKRQIGRPSTVVTFRKQSGDSARAARIGFAGDSAASARGGLSRRQERAVLAGSFAAP